jgi:hypothetical protein
MIFSSCPHEKEVAELLARGHWEHACSPELRDHVSACRTCGDLVLVSTAFQSARAQAAGAASVGSPGPLWWRAQLRRRNEALMRVGKPLLGAQIFALAVSLLLAGGFLSYLAKDGVQWLTWREQFRQAPGLFFGSLWPSALFNSGWSLSVMIPVLATLALLSGVVVYLASERQ